MPEPDYVSKDGTVRLYCGDCFGIIPELEAGIFDAVVTDPPYPDWMAEEYRYFDGILDFLKTMKMRQLIFWTTKREFPLDFTARHVWDKKTGCGSEYEFIYERNGHKNYKVFRHYLINSTVAASFTKDVWTGHKSQKPIALIVDCVKRVKGGCILDPFMGTGTTGVACVRTGKKFVGIELDRRYFDVAVSRIEKAFADQEMVRQGE